MEIYLYININFADFQRFVFGCKKVPLLAIFYSDKYLSNSFSVYKCVLEYILYTFTQISRIFATHTSNAHYMLQKGTKAPNFKGVDENGQPVSLADYAGKKLVLYFYPKDSTPGCTAEACNLRDNYQQLLSQGYQVLGVSRDSAASHSRFIEKNQLPFHLIADTDLSIIKAYDVWGEKKMCGKVSMGVLRTTYVIDEQGVIVEAIGKVDTKNHAAQIL